MFTFSTHEASRVSCPVVKIIETLRAAGYGIPDIAIVVHNHFSPTGFTDADRATYQYLKARGFCGSFGIWYTALKEYKDIERDK